MDNPDILKNALEALLKKLEDPEEVKKLMKVRKGALGGGLFSDIVGYGIVEWSKVYGRPGRLP